MKRILLVFTGGTIGSRCEDGSINTSNEARFTLLDMFNRQFKQADRIDFTVIQPLQLLSENLQPSVWTKLINAIEAEHPESFDGVIITHGTDTLAFSAAALGLYFNRLDIPLLLVSSNYPLGHAEANGLDNFICAVDYILQEQLSGAYVPYRNPGQSMQVHIATRLASSLQLSGDFVSVQSQPYLLYQNGRFLPQYDIDRHQCNKMALHGHFSSKILLIRPYPGLDYSTFNLDGVTAVLHDLYHSGTACSIDEFGAQHSLSAFIQTCHRQGIKVYLAPALHHPDSYISTLTLIAQGAEIIWNMSLESAYLKLLLAYGNFDQPQALIEFLQQDIALEHVPF